MMASIFRALRLALLCVILGGTLTACGDDDSGLNEETDGDAETPYEGESPGQCDNDADDDRDGLFDCDDDGCQGSMACRDLEGNGGSAGSGGSAGQVGDGGEAGQGGDAGEGGQAGSAGHSGTGGVAGSTGGGGESGSNAGCLTDREFFVERAWVPIFESNCIACHQEGGLAATTQMVFRASGTDGWVEHNLAQIENVIVSEPGTLPPLLLKPTGRHPDGHTGGQLLNIDSPAYLTLVELVERLEDRIDECGDRQGEADPIEPVAGCDEIQPGRRMLRRLSHVEYQNTIRDLLGMEIDAKGAFVSDVIEEGFDNQPERLDVSALLADQYREMAESLAEGMDLNPVLPCEIAEGDVRCAHRFIAQFGRRAYRRPLTAQEIDRYRQLYALVVEQECFEQGIRWVVTAMLQSPHFLYRSELGRRDGDTFQLTSYELASELSYLFWQTMPDEELFARAADGQLLDPAVLSVHVQRLMDDPRSIPMLHDFVGQWLGTNRLMQVVRDSEIYAALYFELREAMAQEIELFFGDLWSRNRPLSDVFNAQETWLNEELSEYYGIELGNTPANNIGFHQVDASPTRGVGVLTKGAFLTTHAAPTSSSPIHRGVVVRERVLCDHLEPPPDGLDIMPPAFDPELTTREQFAAHSENDQCRGCHRLIDPIGFGFEAYDGIGRFRQMEAGQRIDTAGELVRLGGESTPFDGVRGLGDVLADEPAVTRCYARQWLRFSFGETEGLNADCYVDVSLNALSENENRIQTALAILTRTPHFTRRVGEETEMDAPAVELTPVGPNLLPDVDDPAEPPDDLEEIACGTPPPMGEGGGVGDPRLRVDIRDDRWDTGYCQYVTVTNIAAEPLNGWMVSIDVEGVIDNAWNVHRDGDSGDVIFSNVEWNSLLNPEQSAEFGYCAAL